MLPSSVERLRRDGQQRAGRHRAVQARLAGQPADLAAPVIEGVHVPLDWLGRRAEDGRLAGGAGHADDLQPRRRHRLVADDQAVGVLGGRGVQQPAVAQEARGPRSELQPGRIGVRLEQPRRARLGIDGPDLAAAVIAGVQDQQQPGRIPPDRQEVGKLVGRDVDARGRAVQAGQQQADVRVGRAGERVPLPHRLGRRIRRITQPPGRDVMLADPRHQQPLAIGTPPAAVVAAHLLGGAELGRAEAHLRVRVRQLQQHPAVQAGDPQRPSGQPGDRVPVRAELRVDARARDRNLARA